MRIALAILVVGAADAALRGGSDPADINVKTAKPLSMTSDEARPASLKKFKVNSGTSGSKVASYWKSAGGSSSTCQTAVAVANPESNFDCSATYTNTGGSIDRGLWQINDYWHPEISDSCAFDCQCNANGAYSISSGGKDWTPWATYNSGAYEKYMSAASGYCGLSFPPEEEENASACSAKCGLSARSDTAKCSDWVGFAFVACESSVAVSLGKCLDECKSGEGKEKASEEWYRKPLSGSTCTGTGEFCCGAPGGDVDNCPSSARTDDCDAKNDCCCG